MMKAAVVMVVVCTLLQGGCAGMSYTEQRVVSGGALGASSGALIGWAAGSPAVGAAVGGAAGMAGGFVYDRYEKMRGRP